MTVNSEGFSLRLPPHGYRNLMPLGRVELFQMTVTEKNKNTLWSPNALELFTAVVKLALHVRIITKTT